MRKTYRIALLLCCLLTALQYSWAQVSTELTLFNETFDTNSGKGGKSKNGASTQYSGSIASNKPKFDNDGWSGTNENKIYGAYQCIRFGTDANGTCTTPDIAYVSASNSIKLTFEAVGWASGTNTLTVSATGATVTGDVSITLQHGIDAAVGDDNTMWESYEVTVTPSAPVFSITFTGKRGFIDNVQIKETVTTVPAPTLTNDFSFWPNTTEAPTTHFTITPSTLTTVYYTTDGSEPTNSSPNVVTMTSNIQVGATTTVKAKAYVGDVPSSEVTKTYTLGETKNSIAGFKTLGQDQEARLYLSAAQNARVLHLNNKKCYLRDNTGTICLDFNTLAAFNPTPQHDQHVAGWIVGKYQTVSNMPTFVATGNTTTEYLAFATPVTETATEPVAIDHSDVNDHRNDWVRIENFRVPDGGAGINDIFNVITTTPAYDGALIDVSGIVTADNTVSPVSYNSIKPLVYVIDEDQSFTSPASDISGASVRLKRTLSSSYWNTFCVPFDIASMEGARKFDHMDGKVMVFQDATGIEAGKPYLVKPTADIVNPEYDDVTLKSIPAQTNGSGGYNFIGTYSPIDLATDHTQLFLGTDGKLYYPADDASKGIKGLRAYFSMPAGAHIGLMIDGETTSISEELRVKSEEFAPATEWYDLQGRKVVNGTLSNGKLPKGLYIVNGKKMVIH